MSNLSRRSLVGAAAALPALALPAIAAAALPALAKPAVVSAVPGPDPVFALIEQHRLAYDACGSSPDGDIPDELADRWFEIQHRLVETKPTTLAGIVAVMRHYRELLTDGVHLLSDENADASRGWPAWTILIEQSLEEIAAKHQAQLAVQS